MKRIQLSVIIICAVFSCALVFTGCDTGYEKTESDKKRDYKCGETGHYHDYNITIEEPNGVEPDSYGYAFTVPIHIESKSEEVKFTDENFYYCVGLGEIELDKDEEYDGTLYIDKGRKYVEFDSDPGLFSSGDGKWRFDKENLKGLKEEGRKAHKEYLKKLQSKPKNCKTVDEICKQEDKSIIKITGFFWGEDNPGFNEYRGYKRTICVGLKRGFPSRVYISLKKDEYKKIKEYHEDDTITVKGELVLKGYNAEERDYNTEPFQKLPLLDHGEILNK